LILLKALDGIGQDGKHQSFLGSPVSLLAVNLKEVMRSKNVRLKKRPELNRPFSGCCFVHHDLLILPVKTAARSTP
jgi:hypothetical protein